LLEQLRELGVRMSAGQLVFADESSWQDALRRWQLTDERHVRIVTEGALLASVLSHGVSPDLAVVSDDAGQFRVLCHSLCWIHAERILAKLVDQLRSIDQAQPTESYRRRRSRASTARAELVIV